MQCTLMLLGAALVLLLAGGFPPVGAPAVYHGGAMLLVGVGVCACCLWGAGRLAAGAWASFVAGLACVFLAGAGAVGVWSFGGEALRLAGVGGAMWFGAVGVGCLAAIGALFVGIFGFIAWRVMQRRLWLAALHLCTSLALVGAAIDLLYSESIVINTLPRSEGPSAWHAETKGGARVELRCTGFELERYAGAVSYSLLRYEGGRWAHAGTPELRGDRLTLGEESWPVSSLRRVEGMPHPFLLLPDGRLLLAQQDAPVKDYRAQCRFTISRPGQPAEEQAVTLRVNEPAECEGWLFYLMSYRPLSLDRTEVSLVARRAPGRFLTLLSLVGIALSAACWCFCPRDNNKS